MGNILLPFGRMRRVYYWLYAIILGALGSIVHLFTKSGEFPIAAFILSFIIFWPSLMIGIQRAKDTGYMSNLIVWLVAAPFAPGAFLLILVTEGLVRQVVSGCFLVSVFLVLIMNLIFLFAAGTVGPNRFGQDPRGRSARKHKEVL